MLPAVSGKLASNPIIAAFSGHMSFQLLRQSTSMLLLKPPKNLNQAFPVIK
jgi:hypothetical protein